MQHDTLGGIWKQQSNITMIRNCTQINQWETCVTIIPNFKHIKMANAGIIIRNPYSAEIDLRTHQFPMHNTALGGSI